MLYLCLPHFCAIFKILQPFRFHKFSLYVSFLTDASERILKISSLHSSQLSCTSGSHAIGSSKQMTHRSVCFFPHLRFNLEKGTGITLVSLPRRPGPTGFQYPSSDIHGVVHAWLISFLLSLLMEKHFNSHPGLETEIIFSSGLLPGRIFASPCTIPHSTQAAYAWAIFSIST